MTFLSPRRLLPALAAALLLSGVPLGEGPAAREPLLVEGKTTLYQRILTRPGAQVMSTAGGDERVDVPPPFTAFYVFAREEAAGRQWLEVGPGVTAEPTGWLPEVETVAWRQAMVLTFANPADRLPTLFFEDEDSLYDVVEDERLPVIAPGLVEETRAGEPPEGIVSIEPDPWPDFREEFYLLPILRAEETYLASGQKAKIVEVASIPLEDESEPPPDPGEFSVGIMFVIDTTISMQPFIDRTRETVQRIFQTIRDSPIGERVSFGMVAYRDSTEGAEALEYLTKLVMPLQLPPDHDAFEQKIGEVEVATVSSLGFNEDGLAGVKAALDRDEWKNFGGRFVIFISDAGLRAADDPRSSTGLAPADINTYARDKYIGILSMLLATPAGTVYHGGAQAQYEALSYWEGTCQPAFYSVPEGALDDFGPTIDELTERLVQQIEAMSRAGTGAGATSGSGGSATCSEEMGERERFIEDAGRIGLAMRLAWLGRESGARAPSVFKAWAPDFALDNPPGRKAFEIRLLLTKNQLSNLAAALKVVDLAGRDLRDSDPATFFDQLRTVVAKAAVEPSEIEGLDPTVLPDPDSIDNLGDLMGEYLDGLPYRSPLMNVTEDAWVTAGPAFQDQILSSVRSKIRAYGYLYDDVDAWVRLHPDAPDGDLVYPMPLELLP